MIKKTHFKFKLTRNFPLLSFGFKIPSLTTEASSTIPRELNVLTFSLFSLPSDTLY